ncbi:hypothetical protein XELAEV_18013119mg [Xenopus laevis]|uniref:Transmembrane protein n=1 Tax=Xenopus laevis TaxID=8355 RepID=A0A974HZC2_XENLA|nr:hypothetical protein XELAEV_18013119mg [Xenopus laevis]
MLEQPVLQAGFIKCMKGAEHHLAPPPLLFLSLFSPVRLPHFFLSISLFSLFISPFFAASVALFTFFVPSPHSIITPVSLSFSSLL